jgi:hypothetical protein
MRFPGRSSVPRRLRRRGHVIEFVIQFLDASVRAHHHYQRPERRGDCQLVGFPSGAVIHYSLDGTMPTTSSQIYNTPFLVSSDLTVEAIAVASGYASSSVTSKSFSLSIASGTLVWSDEFANSTSSIAEPESTVWTYDAGSGGWGNGELENYCALGSMTFPARPLRRSLRRHGRLSARCCRGAIEQRLHLGPAPLMKPCTHSVCIHASTSTQIKRQRKNGDARMHTIDSLLGKSVGVRITYKNLVEA